MIRNISTNQQSFNLRTLVSQQKSELNRAGMELATGLRQDVYSQAGAAPSQALEFRSRMSANDTYRVANETLATRMQVTVDTLGDARQISGDFKDLLISGDIASMNRDTLKSSARNALDSLVAKLNTSYNGQSLFSGTATDQVPLVIEPDNSVTYNGGVENLTSRISDDTVIDTPIRADLPAFKDIFDALTSVINEDLDAMTVPQFNEYQTTLAENIANAEMKVVEVEARLGDNQVRLDRMLTRQSDMSRIYTDAILDIESVEPEEAAVRVEALSNQLKSTFEVTARMSQMTILDYIR